MRRVTSIVLLATFLILSVSGVQIALMPKRLNVPRQTQASIETDNPATRREKPFYPRKAHEWTGYVFIIAGIVHIILNKKIMFSYLGGKNK
jgi:cytochrome b561